MAAPELRRGRRGPLLRAAALLLLAAAADARSVGRPPSGGATSPPPLSPDTSGLEKQAGLQFRPPATTVRARVERGAALARERPASALSVALAARLLLAHVRIQLEKRRALRAFEGLGRDFHVTIVTTAALPWKTGTSVNALLRAAYVADAGHAVTLCVPWVDPAEQANIFPGQRTFATPAEQEAHMREWLAARDGAHAAFEVRFYPARYDVVRGSVLPLGDTTKWTGDADAPRDLCVLEEPEHLNWYHGGRNWRRRFKLVVGVVHTNYISYAELYQPENVFIVRSINSLCARAYCDRTIKLSDCLQKFARTAVCNVHGCRSEFIDEGRRRAKGGAPFGQGAYFIGKVLWAKGLRYLLEYLSADEGGAPAAALEAGEGGRLDVAVDVFGTGDDLAEVEAAAAAASLDLRFMGSRDHADASLHAYKVFVNPSRTEVLSTTTAEALAMGKFVVIERNPSNEFFYRFANALTYETKAEFRRALEKALASTPAPLTEEESRALSWAGATERFLDAVGEASRLATAPTLADEAAHCAHLSLTGWKGYVGDALKKFVFESGPISRQRWLHKERRYRNSADPTEVVAKSLRVCPPAAVSWSERYAGGKESWTKWIPFSGKKKKAA